MLEYAFCRNVWRYLSRHLCSLLRTPQDAASAARKKDAVFEAMDRDIGEANLQIEQRRGLYNGKVGLRSKDATRGSWHRYY